jgi:PD-(D/E)XK nuclease superfamily
MDAILNDTNLLANHAKRPFLFSKEAVQHCAFLLLKEHKKAVLRICEAFKPKKLTKGDLKSCFYGFFGELGSRHGLYPGRRIGFNAYERQITEGIVKFLDSANHGDIAETRLKGFLLALLEGRSQNERLISSLKDAYSFSVQAEKLIPSTKRRIDIFIGWNPNPFNSKKFEYGLIIEAKFEHKVTRGTLPDYRQHARVIFESPDNTALILLTLEGFRSPKNRDWQPVQWLTLMSRWERNLNDDDTDFTQFRRFIWKKIGN